MAGEPGGLCSLPGRPVKEVGTLGFVLGHLRAVRSCSTTFTAVSPFPFRSPTG